MTSLPPESESKRPSTKAFSELKLDADHFWAIVKESRRNEPEPWEDKQPVLYVCRCTYCQRQGLGWAKYVVYPGIEYECITVEEHKAFVQKDKNGEFVHPTVLVEYGFINPDFPFGLSSLIPDHILSRKCSAARDLLKSSGAGSFDPTNDDDAFVLKLLLNISSD